MKQAQESIAIIAPVAAITFTAGVWAIVAIALPSVAAIASVLG